MKTAAAVLVQNKEGKVLGFKRHDTNLVGLPSGKIEPDERAVDTAIRECFEETGYKVRLVIGGPPDLKAYEPEYNTLVTTFTAEIVGGELSSGGPEGTPGWFSPRVMVSGGGALSAYNRSLFEFFGIEIPLAGKFHSHITLKHASMDDAERVAKLTKGKVTFIHLERPDSVLQVDAMITHHYVTGQGLSDSNDVIHLAKLHSKTIEAAGVQTTRVKVEHEPLHPKSLRGSELDQSFRLARYIEGHVKVSVRDSSLIAMKSLAARQGWHPSRNPYQKHPKASGEEVIQFINRRWYSEHKKLPNILSSIATLCSSLEKQLTLDIIEVKIESAIFDSKEDLVSWWID